MPKQAAHFYYNQAVRQHQRGDLQAAIADYSEAIRLRPDAHALYGRAVAQQALGKPDRAEADYTAAIGLYPNFADADHHRAVIRAERKNLAGAPSRFDL